MGHQRYIQLTPWIVSFLCLGLAGCSHDKPKPDEASSLSTEDTELGSSDQGKAFGLQTIHFAYDSYLLAQDTQAQLTANAEILKSHSSARVQIEGHCDNRGGIQYNIALGEKRANSVKKYLVDLGIPEGRLATISYGKERPLVSGDDEESYTRNRRANFAVTSK